MFTLILLILIIAMMSDTRRTIPAKPLTRGDQIAAGLLFSFCIFIIYTAFTA